jgi:hypothetical protein
MAFLENNTRASDEGRPSLATATRPFRRPNSLDRSGGSTGWVCLLLAILGFGGGLSIALLGFNSSEESGTVAAVRSEPRYLPPGEAMLTAGGVVGDAKAPAEAESRRVASGINSFGGLGTSLEQTSDAALSETFELASLNPSFDGFGAISMEQSLASPQRSAMAGTEAPSGVDAAAGPQGDFAAVLAPVPEPSTWVMILSGAALVMGKLRRRATR